MGMGWGVSLGGGGTGVMLKRNRNKTEARAVERDDVIRSEAIFSIRRKREVSRTPILNNSILKGIDRAH